MAAPPIIEPKRYARRAPTSGNSQEAVPFDFQHADVVPADQLHALESVYSGFARSLAGGLSGYLRTYVSAVVERVEQISFEAFLGNTGAASTLLPLKMRPEESTAMMAVSHDVSFPLLEILLGGAGRATARMDRHLTEIEKSLFEPIVRIILHEFKTAWQPLVPVEFVLESANPPPHLQSVMPRNEALIAARLDLRLPEAGGVLHLALPSRALRQRLPIPQSAKAEAAPQDRSEILNLIGRAEFDVSVSLNGPRMLFRDLLNIEAGDVIAFDHPLGQELDLELNGVSKFKGHVVARGSKRAFHIKRELPSSRS
jgi:flagellar motor switch protein FliM